MVGLTSCFLVVGILHPTLLATGNEVKIDIDPLTRYCHINYPVPKNTPNVVKVTCSWSPVSANAWQTAKVRPLVSETALRLAPAFTPAA